MDNFLIAQEDIDRLNSLSGAIKTASQNLVELLPHVSKLQADLASSAKDYKKLTDAITRYEEVVEKVNTTMKGQNKAILDLQKAQIKIVAAKSEEAKQTAALNQQIRLQNQENRVAAKEAMAVAGSMNELSANISKATIALRNMDSSTPEFKVAQSNVAEMQKRLRELEMGAGSFGRNVGNYSSAFNPLNFQIQQLVREMPSLTVSLPQFFLALSNNIPMFANEVNKARAAQKLLREEGQKGIPVWKQLLKGIVSWQTALVLGITLITAYGKEIAEWVKGLFGAERGLISTSKAIRRMREAMDFNDLGRQIADFKKLVDLYRDLGDSAEEKRKFLVEYKSDIESTGLAIRNVTEADNAFINNTDEYIAALKARSIAEAGMKLAAEQYAKAIEAEVDINKKVDENLELIKLYKDKDRNFLVRLSAGAKATGVFQSSDMLASFSDQIEDLVAKRDKFMANGDNFIDVINDMSNSLNLTGKGIKPKKNKEINDFVKEELQAISEMRELTNSELIAMNSSIAGNERLSYQERIEALDEFIGLQEDRINTTAENQRVALIRQAMEEGYGYQEALVIMANQLKLVNVKSQEEINKITREGAETRVSILEYEANKKLKIASAEAKQRSDVISTNESNLNLILARQYAAGEITQEEYEKRKTDSVKLHAMQRFDAEMQSLRHMLSLVGNDAVKREQIEKSMADARLKYAKYVNGELIKEELDEARKREWLEEQMATKRKEIAKEVFNFISELGNALFETQLNQLEKLAETEAEKADADRDRIENLEEAGAISKEQADARKAAVDDKESKREKKLEREKIAIQRKQAIFNKAMSIAQIGIDTATSIMKTTAFIPMPAAAPLVALISALGAIQLATVLATPIPQYALGTDNHPGGLAIVGDAGKHELAVTTSGGAIKTPNKPTLIDLPKGTQVYPDYEKAIAAMAFSQTPTAEQINSAVDYSLFREMADLQRESTRVLRGIERGGRLDRGNRFYFDTLARMEFKTRKKS